MANKYKVKSLSLPWEIDSIADFKIIADEDSKIEIEFNAFFGEHIESPILEIETIKYYYDNHLEYKKDDFTKFKYQRIKLIFDNFVNINFSYCGNDIYDDLDRSLILFEDLRHSSFENYLSATHKYWQENLICVDTRCYEVVGTNWMMDNFQHVYEKQGCNHYLIQGREYKIELIATKPKWESMYALLLEI